LDRRFLLLSFAGVAVAAAGTRPAKSQTFSSDPVEVPRFAEAFKQRPVLDRVFLDVAYVQSWRAQIAPRGYESDGEWVMRAARNRAAVWDRLGGDVVAAVSSMADFVSQYQKVSLEAYEKNKTDFAAFLTNIGIAAEGPAGTRLVESLRDFTLLNAGALGPEVEEAAKESFFWPFC
jgi:hypothetical protein